MALARGQNQQDLDREFVASIANEIFIPRVCGPVHEDCGPTWYAYVIHFTIG